MDCRNCHERWRADKIDGTCPNCGSTDLTEARAFNLMFKTYAGPVEEDATVAYLRPETAQGMFVNFLNVLQTTGRSRPSGSPRWASRSATRSRRRTSSSAPASSSRWRWSTSCRPTRPTRGSTTGSSERFRWYLDLGIPADHLRLRHHDPDELSHYSAGTADVEFLFPWGWDELEGIANRTDFDLKAHAQASGERLEYFDQASGERYVPYVIEPAAGATRTMMAFLLAAYDEDEVGGEPRTVLASTPVWPLPGGRAPPVEERHPGAAVPRGAAPPAAPVMCDFDVTQSIGKRYRRQDEVGTPLCVTVDFESLEDRAVTVRDRDTHGPGAGAHRPTVAAAAIGGSSGCIAGRRPVPGPVGRG